MPSFNSKELRLEGLKCGLLTAVKPLFKDAKSRWVWLCECDCGNQVQKVAELLKRGGVKSCGCLRRQPRKDLTGLRFNKLTALETAGRPPKLGWCWKCACDCGREVVATATALQKGRVGSCGCQSSETLRSRRSKDSPTYQGFEDLSGTHFGIIRTRAARTGREFDVTIEYLWKLYQDQGKKCAYTGKFMPMPVTLRKRVSEQSSNTDYTASLDRINSTKGYVPGNVHWVCRGVNFMKQQMSEEDFFEWIKDIYAFRIKKTEL